MNKMREEYRITELDAQMLPIKVLKAHSSGARLVQICSVSTDTGYDLFYSFALDYKFVNYKVKLGFSESIVSISDIFPSAALYENEMAELFGVKIEYINLDYQKHLYNIDVETPFKKEKKEEENNG